MHYAAASGNPYHALLVIFEQASNEILNGQSVITAMHLAAAQGFDEALAVLLSKVNNPNAFDAKGRTALHLAALNGHQRVLETLVKNHALVCIHDGTENKQTAVHVAAANGHEQCLLVLLENTEVS